MEYYVSYKQNNVHHGLLVEAPGPKAAERYILSKKPSARFVSAREAFDGDRKPGIPVLELSDREQTVLRDSFLAQRVDELDLSVRTYNALRRAGIQTVGDLVNKTEAEVAKVPYLGWKCLDEIKSVLAKHGETLAAVARGAEEAPRKSSVITPRKPPLNDRIVSVAHFAESKEVRDVVLASDALRNDTLNACYSIPGYTKLSRQERNALYDLVKKAISLTRDQGKEAIHVETEER